MQNSNQKPGLNERINDFVQRNRKGILLSIGAVLFLLVAAVVYFSLNDYLNKKAIARVEELNTRFVDIRGSLDDESVSGEVEQLLSSLETFAGNGKGVARSRAWAIIGQIYSIREDWPAAESAWTNAAIAGEKTYLGPIALFNAAAAAEEQGNLEQAVELLQKCVSHKIEFPAAPRAQFSIGRLYEQLGNTSSALEAYRAVLVNWSNMPIWQHLARSRITAIEISD